MYHGKWWFVTKKMIFPVMQHFHNQRIKLSSIFDLQSVGNYMRKFEIKDHSNSFASYKDLHKYLRFSVNVF